MAPSGGSCSQNQAHLVARHACGPAISTKSPARKSRAANKPSQLGTSHPSRRLLFDRCWSRVTRNPGCPRCGYVGWILATIPVKSAAPPRRSGADRLLRLPAQSH